MDGSKGTVRVSASDWESEEGYLVASLGSDWMAAYDKVRRSGGRERKISSAMYYIAKVESQQSNHQSRRNNNLNKLDVHITG
jgi:hypothetical protein